MIHSSKWRLAINAGLAALALGSVGALGANPAAAQSAEGAISIPAQPLADALRLLGRQSGTEIIFDEDSVTGRNSVEVTTNQGVEAALRRILEGSGLNFKRGDSGVIIVGTPSALAAVAVAAPEDPVGDVIVVSGRRLDSEIAIDVKRNADQVVDVLTADDNSRLPDNNVAESLSRIPGVSVQRSGETGTGSFVSVRGLDSALLNVQFDGVSGGAASSGSRSVPLDGITADNVAEIRVSKSLLPEDDGIGVGGSINIKTKTPLSGGRDRYRVNASGRYSEFAEKLGYDFGGSLTKIITDNFGVSLSASFRRRFTQNLELDSSSSHISGLSFVRNAAGEVLTAQDILDLGLDDAGTDFDDLSAGIINPRNIVFEDYSYQLQVQRRDTISLSGAVDWRPAENTLLTLGGRYNREKTRANEYSISFDEDDRDFENIGGLLIPEFRDAEIDVEAQIEDETRVTANAYLKGKTEFDTMEFDYQVGYSKTQRKDPQTDIFFDTDRLLDRDNGDGLVQFHPYTFVNTYFPVPNQANRTIPQFVQAISDIAGTQNIDFLEADIVNENTNDRYFGRLDATFFPSSFGDFINEIKFGTKFERSDLRTDDQTTLDGDPEFINADGSFAPGEDGTAEDFTLGQFEGLYAGNDNNSLSFVGSPLRAIGLSGVPTLDRGAFLALRDNFINSYTGGLDTDFFDAREDTLAGYFQAKVESGDFDGIFGFRYEHFKGSYSSPLQLNANLNIVDSTGERSIRLSSIGEGDTISSSTTNNEFLPRMNGRYQFSNNFQMRFGVGYSLARPSYRQLGRATDVRVFLEASDPTGQILPGVTDAAGVVAGGGVNIDQITQSVVSVLSGNPNLKNARSLNLDLSFEYYPIRGTALTLGLFHKRIENFIFVGQESASGAFDSEQIQSLLSPDGQSIINGLGGLQGIIDNGRNVDVSINQPTNGDLAKVSGIELGISHQFDWAPGWLENVGMNANLTFTRSRANYVIVPAASPENPDDGLRPGDAEVVLGYAQAGDALIRRTSFFRSPDVTANASIFYEDKSLEVALSASYQSESFRATDDYGLDQFTAAYFQLDFFAAYELPWDFADVKLFFEVPDITDGGRKAVDAQTAGRGGSAYDEASFNGREFRFGVRAKF